MATTPGDTLTLPGTVLVIGACGQLGLELTAALRQRYQPKNVVAADVRAPKNPDALAGGPFELLDVLDKDRLEELIRQYRPVQVYHLAALLSATAEKDPMFAWKLNMDGLLNVLNLAVQYRVPQVYWPSSIAVFGPDTPRDHTPQVTIMNPNTVYGISIWPASSGASGTTASTASTCAACATPASSATRACPAVVPPTTPWTFTTRLWPVKATSASWKRIHICR